MIEAEEDVRFDILNDLQGGEECHVEAIRTLLYLSSSGHTPYRKKLESVCTIKLRNPLKV